MSPKDKICLPQDLADLLPSLTHPLVMSNGVFDVLRRGHVSYLHRAAELGSSLLIAVNSDASARMLGKGPDRPLNGAEDRAYVLAGLESVALVTFFDTRTPVELIQTVHPDIYVKDGDYDMETLEETRVVRSWGGQSVAIPFLDGFSTTALVKRIRNPVQPAFAKPPFWTAMALSTRTRPMFIAGKISSSCPVPSKECKSCRMRATRWSSSPTSRAWRAATTPKRSTRP